MSWGRAGPAPTPPPKAPQGNEAPAKPAPLAEAQGRPSFLTCGPMQPDWNLEAERVARDAFGLDASATPLPGELDRNYRLDAADGRRLLLKLHRPDTEPAVLDLQD